MLAVREGVTGAVDFFAVLEPVTIGVRVVRIGTVFLLFVVGQAVLVRISGTIILARLLAIVRRILRISAVVDLGAVVDATIIRIRIVRVSDLVGADRRVKLVTIVQAITVGVLGQRVRVTGLAVRIELVVLERVLRTVNLVTVVDAITVGIRVVRVGAVFLLLVVGQAILIRISRTIILARLIARLRLVISAVGWVSAVVDLGAVVDATIIRIRIVRVSDLVGADRRVKLVTIVQAITVGVLGQRVRVTGLAVRIELVVLERVLRTVNLVTVVDAITVGIRVVRVGAVFLLLVVGQAILIGISRTIVLTRLVTRLVTRLLTVI